MYASEYNSDKIEENIWFNFVNTILLFFMCWVESDSKNVKGGRKKNLLFMDMSVNGLTTPPPHPPKKVVFFGFLYMIPRSLKHILFKKKRFLLETSLYPKIFFI